jgi:homoserine O-acetyltransferase
MKTLRLLTGVALFLFALPAFAVDYPAPKEGEWIAHDFKFHTGETLAELKLHYTTVGDPAGLPVLVLHGTSGSAASVLTPAFAGELLGPGPTLDASKYFIVIPDAIGHGKSSKPSDRLRTQFPQYDYSDMVEAQHRLLTEGLGIKHVRLIIGNSMGGCIPGFGARCTRTTWTSWCPWLRNRRRWQAGIGCCAG